MGLYEAVWGILRLDLMLIKHYSVKNHATPSLKTVYLVSLYLSRYKILAGLIFRSGLMATRGISFDSPPNQPLLLFCVTSANVIHTNFDLSTEFSRLLRFLVINLVFYYRAVNGVMTTKSRFNDYQK
mgnify:CR=1 FL=1